MGNNLTTLSDFVQVLRRRWWIVVVVVLIALASAYAYSKHESPLYSAHADVRLSAQPINSSVNATIPPNATQVEVTVGNETLFATDSNVVSAAIKASGLQESPSEFLQHGSVSGDTTNAILTFSYDASTGPEARRVVTQWAQAYTKLADQRDTQTLDNALAPLIKTRKRQAADIQRLNAQGRTTEAQAEALLLRGTSDKIQNLQTLRQGIPGNRQVTPPTASSKVRPRTSRNLLAGFGLGLVLAFVIVGMLEALDTRVRRSDEVGDVLGLPLLSRIPTPRRSQEGRLAMVDDNDQHYSEAYRKLRVNMDFANIRAGAKTVMVTSALEQEGKSTTVANLAVAMARAGRHVVLVDLDLRQPSIHKFFGLQGAAGLTEMALDHVHLEDALYHVPIVGASGRLDVVPVGGIPPSPADFLESPAIDAVLGRLADRADIVLIDTAPLLPVSDSIALSAKVEAMLLVVHAGMKRNVVIELHRALAACQAPCFGFVLTGAERETDGYYGAGYGYGYGGTPTAPAAPQTASGNGRPVSVGQEARSGPRAAVGRAAEPPDERS